jgi:hypothetical protein
LIGEVRGDALLVLGVCVWATPSQVRHSESRSLMEVRSFSLAIGAKAPPWLELHLGSQAVAVLG